MTIPVRRTFGFSTREGSLNETARCVRVIASTDAIDSYGEIVEQTWNLERYRANPVVLYNHASSSRSHAETLPIGRATECEVVNGRLEATIKFADARANPMAEQVWQCVRQGLLNAVSVGFAPRTIREEKRAGSDVLVLSDNELFEISVVPLPANHEAVMLSADRSDSREALLKLARSNTEAIKAQETSNMSTPELETLQAEIAAVRGNLDDERSKAAELTSQVSLLTQELDITRARAEQAEARATALDAVLAERDVDALVGKKITPAERAAFLELRASNPKLFEQLVKSRPDLPHTAQVTRAESEPNKVATPASSKGLADVVAKRARASS